MWTCPSSPRQTICAIAGPFWSSMIMPDPTTPIWGNGNAPFRGNALIADSFSNGFVDLITISASEILDSILAAARLPGRLLRAAAEDRGDFLIECLQAGGEPELVHGALGL